ncbi:MAG: lipopolysaccharide biosynthesis protein [Chloroflexi bacterium]|nr:MAG: lipopolysaccharide biosynthesis protein [Chloroflexota bacterium]
MSMRRDYITTFVAEALVVVSYLLAFRLVAVFLGTTGFGEYSLSRRTLSLLLPLVVLGLDVGVARYVSYAEANKADGSSAYPPAALLMLGAGAAVLSAVLLVFNGFWAQVFFGSATYSGLVVAMPVLIVGGGAQVIAYSYLRGMARIQWANVVYVLNFAVVPIAAIVLFRDSVELMLIAMGAGWLVVAGVALSRLPLSIHDLKSKVRELARFGVPRIPGDFVSLLLFAMPGILVAHAADIRVAGIVAFGIAALGMIGTALTPVSFVLLPFASRMFAAGSVKRLRTEMAEVVGITMAGTLVVVVATEVFAGQIVNAYLGPGFAAGADVLRLTMVGALPWGVYVTLRSVIDARHVRPVNARNIVISFLCFVLFALLLPRVTDQTTSAVLAFVIALWILAGLTIFEVSRISEFVKAPADRSPLALVKLGALAALPAVVLVSSPQRTLVSAGFAAVYVVIALFSFKFSRANRFMLAYVGVAALWMILSWLRSRYLLHLTPDQLDYGGSKIVYFVFIVLPMAAAVSIMIDKAEDAWPAAGGQLLLGIVIALVTVALLGDRFLGADRYSWQGNLIALGTLVAVQPWLIRNLWISGAVGVLGVVGILFADARQSLAAFGVGLLLSGVYWGAIAFRRASGSTSQKLRNAIAKPYVILPLVLVALTVVAIGVTYNPSNPCHCVTDRLIVLEVNAGDRDKLLHKGLTLVVESPLLGTGVGSFDGLVADTETIGHVYQYPHNVPLEVAAETGLIGFLLIIVPLLVGWVAFFWSGIKRASPAVAGITMILAIFFVVANLSGDIPSDRGMWIFGIVAFKLGMDGWQTQLAEARVRMRSRMDAASPAS